jgi:DNA-binding NtrC family response regulator
MNESFDGLIDRLVTGGFFLEEAVELLEKGMIERQLRQYAGNQSSAAKALGIHRNTLLRKMLQYGIGTKRPRSKPVASAKSKPAPAKSRKRSA